MAKRQTALAKAQAHKMRSIIQWNGKQWGRCWCGRITDLVEDSQPLPACPGFVQRVWDEVVANNPNMR